MSSIARWIDSHAGFTPNKPALRCGGEAITYSEFARRIERTARGLVGELALKPGDRIAWLGPNDPQMLVLLFAAAKAGLVLVPLNWRLAPPEHCEILADCGAEVLFATVQFLEAAALALPAGCRLLSADTALDGPPGNFGGDISRPLLIVYTSGTTGRPKGAVLTQEAITFNALNSVHMHDMRADDHILTVLPMFHVGGLNIQTTPALYSGATVTLHPRFEPAAALAAIAAEGPTLSVQVPATLQALLSHPEWERTDLSSLRAIATGSTDVPVPLIERLHRRGVPVIQVYGSTETGPVAVYQRIPDAQATVGSVGRPGLHTDVRLVDQEGRDVPGGTPGEILVRGRNLATGYWNAPAASAAAFRDGWFHSGDVAAADEAGWLWFKDRLRNVIISGGENIYSAELERVLREMPEVAECAVVGRPDSRWGEVPVAVIVPVPGAEATEKAILGAFQNRLARYKHPKNVVFVEALPRNVMGKVEVDQVRALAENAATASM